MNVEFKWLAIGGLGLIGAGCNAGFEDLRPPQSDAAIPIVDAGVVDAGGPRVRPDAGQAEVVISTGVWTGRSDYRATGTAEVVRLPNGQSELRLSNNFSVSSVPGPVLVLSYRDRLGSNLDPSQGDVELGPLTGGVRNHAIPSGADDRLYAWVYCRPFRIEVARAALENVQ